MSSKCLTSFFGWWYNSLDMLFTTWHINFVLQWFVSSALNVYSLNASSIMKVTSTPSSSADLWKKKTSWLRKHFVMQTKVHLHNVPFRCWKPLPKKTQKTTTTSKTYRIEKYKMKKYYRVSRFHFSLFESFLLKNWRL